MSEFIKFWNGKDSAHAGYLDALKGIAILAVTLILLWPVGYLCCLD